MHLHWIKQLNEFWFNFDSRIDTNRSVRNKFYPDLNQIATRTYLKKNPRGSYLLNIEYLLSDKNTRFPLYSYQLLIKKNKLSRRDLRLTPIVILSPTNDNRCFQSCLQSSFRVETFHVVIKSSLIFSQVWNLCASQTREVDLFLNKSNHPRFRAPRARCLTRSKQVGAVLPPETDAKLSDFVPTTTRVKIARVHIAWRREKDRETLESKVFIHLEFFFLPHFFLSNFWISYRLLEFRFLSFGLIFDRCNDTARSLDIRRCKV